ncbi:MAG: sugar phosphate isomerase/epimerase [Propionibacteriaceae bacterium]|nr:sugar phosphate isomerase/epimerase [Propionibacteriaceae bacterium]
MKISCLPVSLFTDIVENKMSISDWANAASEIGFTGFDLSMVMVKNHTAAYLSDLKSVLKQVRIPAVMATTYPDFTHPSAVQRQREKTYLEHDISLCAELGIPFLRIVAGQAHQQTTRDAGVRQVVEHFKQADEYAGAAGITLVYENHAKPSAWQHVDFSYPLEIFFEIFEQLGDTGIRINFDIGNVVSLGENPLMVLDKIFPKIDTIHISDMERSGEVKPVVIGTGASPIREVLVETRSRGFDGWYCIEEASGTGLAGIRTAYEYVCGILSEGSC